MAKQATTSEPVTAIVADTWPELKRKKWPVEALGPQPDANAIGVGLASCGGRATLMALANAMRARPHGATNGEVKLATTIAGAQPNEHRNQLAAKLIAGTVKLVSGEMKTAVKVYKGKGNETRNGQTVIVIALPAKAQRALDAAKANEADANAKPDVKATSKATSKRKATSKATKRKASTKATSKASKPVEADAKPDASNQPDATSKPVEADANATS